MSEPLMTAAEIAALLGFSPAMIVDWAESVKLPGFRIGGRLRFRWSEVEAVLEVPFNRGSCSEAWDFLDGKVKDVCAVRRGDVATIRRRQMPTLGELADEFTAPTRCRDVDHRLA
jgi:excisionase family DNA binding protein